jgi:hypothetical protein
MLTFMEETVNVFKSFVCRKGIRIFFEGLRVKSRIILKVLLKIFFIAVPPCILKTKVSHSPTDALFITL